jgi:hypothetical protein
VRGLRMRDVSVLLSESHLCKAKKIQMRLAIKAPAHQGLKIQEPPRREPQ